MNIHDKVGQMFCVGFDGFTAPDHILEWLREGRVGGIILFARNVESAEQLADLTRTLHAAAKYPLLISIDQEGGVIAKMRAPSFSEVPGAMGLASSANGEANAYAAYSIIGREMKAVGMNWDYAPAIDLTYNRQNPTVGTRSFGTDPETVGALASQAVKGLQSHGVAACAKHFPGLGDTAIDTHVALATLNAPIEQLLTRDLIPYRAVIAAGITSIMTTHTVYTALDDTHPATLSGVVINRMLRGELAYDGLIVSDCMEMKAIADNYTPEDYATLGALAGLDIILVSHTVEAQSRAFDGLLKAVEDGRVPLSRIDEANVRIAKMKAMCAVAPYDLSVLRTPDALETGVAIARESVYLHRGALPIDQSKRIMCIEFASVLDSTVVERGNMAGFAKRWHERTGLPAMSIKVDDDERFAEALAAVQLADCLLLTTRSAHLSEKQTRKAHALLAAASSNVLVALRNPYDVAIFPEAQTVLCTSGDSEPQLIAAVEALLGEFSPTGKPPVTLE